MAYTDIPTADIRAHRKNAQWTRLIGISGFVLALAYTWNSGSATGAFAGLAWAGWSNWSATRLEKQALEWENQVENEQKN